MLKQATVEMRSHVSPQSHPYIYFLRCCVLSPVVFGKSCKKEQHANDGQLLHQHFVRDTLKSTVVTMKIADPPECLSKSTL